jgi:hypothetical protein
MGRCWRVHHGGKDVMLFLSPTTGAANPHSLTVTSKGGCTDVSPGL